MPVTKPATDAPTRLRCKNYPKLFWVNPSWPREKIFCSAASRQQWNSYEANDMVRQREFIEKRIEHELAPIRAEIEQPRLKVAVL